jgi:hypothetical protein
VIFGKQVLRRKNGPKRDEVTGGWKKLHNEELHSYLYSTANTMMMIKANVACMGDGKRVQTFGWKARREETTQKTKALTLG